MNTEKENIILKKRIERLQKYVVVLEEQLKKHINNEEYHKYKCKYYKNDSEKLKEMLNSLVVPNGLGLIKSKL